MANKNPLQKCFLFIILISIFLQAETSQISNKKTYVIHMDKSAMPLPYTNHQQWYFSKINSVTQHKSQEGEGEEDNNRILYTYQTAFHGLAAQLTKEEAEKLEDGVVAVIPETRYELHTTRSPTFLGLEHYKKTNRIQTAFPTDIYSVGKNRQFSDTVPTEMNIEKTVGNPSVCCLKFPTDV